MMRKQTEQAREYFQSALDADPDDPNAEYAYATLHRELGDKAATRHHLERAARLPCHPDRKASIDCWLRELGESE